MATEKKSNQKTRDPRGRKVGWRKAGETKVRKNVTLYPSHVEHLKTVAPNTSKALEVLIEAHRKSLS